MTPSAVKRAASAGWRPMPLIVALAVTTKRDAISREAGCKRWLATDAADCGADCARRNVTPPSSAAAAITTDKHRLTTIDAASV